MRIYSDTMTHEHVRRAFHDAQLENVGYWIDFSSDRARVRRYRHDWRLYGTGERHTRYTNLGTAPRFEPSREGGERAATWMDWGWWIAVMFRFDPHARIGEYDGQQDFLTRTAARWLQIRTRDRSCREWDPFALEDTPPGYTPFADLTHLPPNRLLDLTSEPQVEAWLASA